MDFQRFKVMDLVELIHIFGLTNIHTFGPKISLIRLFSLMFNYAKPRMFTYKIARHFLTVEFGSLRCIRLMQPPSKDTAAPRQKMPKASFA